MLRNISIATVFLAGSLAVAAQTSPGNATSSASACKMHPSCNVKQGQMKKMRKSKSSPFLITHGLPHLTKKIKQHWNDPALKLTSEQKAKLTEIRKATLGTIKTLKPKIKRLEAHIVKQSRAGVPASKLQNDVQQLASLKAKATMAHLKCLEQTKNVLNKHQLFYLMSLKHLKVNRMMSQHPTPSPFMKMQSKPMKCAAGKCGAGKSY